MGEPVVDEGRPTRVEGDEQVVLEAAAELDEQERVPLNPLRPLEEFVVRLAAKDVRGDLRDGVPIERSEAEIVGGTGLGQFLLCFLNGGNTLVRSEGQHPHDRQRRESLWELAHRDRAAGARPMEIVETDQERVLKCRFFDQRLDVLEEPEEELRRGVEVTQAPAIGQRRIAFEEGVEERPEFDHPAGLGSSAPDSERELGGDPSALVEESSLAEAGAPLDHDHAAGTPPNLGQPAAYRCEFLLDDHGVGASIVPPCRECTSGDGP